MTVVLPPPLLALTPGVSTARDVAALVTTVGQAIESGLRGVLLREPGLEDRAFLRCAEQLASMLAHVGGWLALHDRPQLVAAAGAQGVHLGFRSVTPQVARALVGADVCIGFSSHRGDRPATWLGADYLFHGPVFATASKPGVEPIGEAALAAFAAAADRPVWALGGITAERLGVIDRGTVAGVAVLGGILACPDPGARVRAYLEAWGA